MGAFSDSMRDTAESLIIQYGADITLIKAASEPMIEQGTMRPYWMIEGVKSYTAPPSVRYAGYATQRNAKSYETLDGRIRITDMVFTTARIPEPTARDHIEWAGTKFSVIHCEPVYVQGNAVVYKVYVRRG